MINEGTRLVKFRCDVLKNNVAVSTLEMSGGRLDCSKSGVIHRTASIMVRSTEGIDLLRDRLRLVMQVFEVSEKKISWSEINKANKTWAVLDAMGFNWRRIEVGRISHGFTDYPLGVFLPLSPTRQKGNGAPSEQLEMYDLCTVLREDCITEPLYFAAGTLYTAVVAQLISSAGIGDAEITPSYARLMTDREFEIGESKLDIINLLLEEINFTTAFADVCGVIKIKPYSEPSMKNVQHKYEAGKLSLIQSTITESADYYSAPNVFIARVSNSDMEEDLTAIYINSNPANKLSTVYRGRQIISEIYNPDGIASQADLDAYVRRKAFEASQIEQAVTVKTALSPKHGIGDVIYMVHPQITGLFEEQGWSMDLTAGGEMTHELRRVIYLE